MGQWGVCARKRPFDVHGHFFLSRCPLCGYGFARGLAVPIGETEVDGSALARSACTEHTTGVVTAVHPVESDHQGARPRHRSTTIKQCPGLPAAPRRDRSDRSGTAGGERGRQ